MILDSITLTIDDKKPAVATYYLDINEGEKLIDTTITYNEAYPEMTTDSLACTHLANYVCIWLNDETQERFYNVRDLIYKAIKQCRELNEIKKDFE